MYFECILKDVDILHQKKKKKEEEERRENGKTNGPLTFRLLSNQGRFE